MDSLTQVVLGGAVGEAVLGRRAGNKAVVWGAVAGTIPDLDVLAGPFLDPVAQADFHRGFSHSLLFSILVAPLLGAIIARIHRKEGLGRRPWSWLAFAGLVTHPLLDIFTTWGTEFFWPFSDAKIALNSVFVIDPLYTLPFLICLIAVLFMRRNNPRRRIVNWIGIAWSCAYLALGLVNKARARTVFMEEFAAQQIEVSDYMTRPTPFNSLLWGVVAKRGETFWMGFHSLPSGSKRVKLQSYVSDPLPPDISSHSLVQDLYRLSKGFLLVKQLDDGWRLSDLRYMSTDFELEGDEEFLFNYTIREVENGELEVELARNAPALNGETMGVFWKSIWEGPENTPE